jgi:hypothetical protein
MTTDASGCSGSVVVDGRDIGEAPLGLGGRRRLTGVEMTVTVRVSELTVRTADDRKRLLGNQALALLRLDDVPGARLVTYLTDGDGNARARRIRPDRMCLASSVFSSPGSFSRRTCRTVSGETAIVFPSARGSRCASNCSPRPAC